MILVFGKSGQVATELQQLCDAVVLGSSQVDLRNPLACIEAIFSFKPNYVINAAAYTAVDKAEDQEDVANIINGDAPAAMAFSCGQLGIPLVHISTDYVFDGSGDKPRLPTDPIAPLNAYGRSKSLGEECIRASEAIYAIVRTSWVFSAHRKNFVKTMLDLSKTHDALHIVNDQIGGPTPARDLAATCLIIAEQLKEDSSRSGTYHFSGNPNVSWAEFAKIIFKQADKSSQVIPISSNEYPSIAKRPLNSRLDCRSTKEIFNIEQPNWQNGLQNTLTELKLIS